MISSSTFIPHQNNSDQLMQEQQIKATQDLQKHLKKLASPFKFSITVEDQKKIEDLVRAGAILTNVEGLLPNTKNPLQVAADIDSNYLFRDRWHCVKAILEAAYQTNRMIDYDSYLYVMKKAIHEHEIEIIEKLLSYCKENTEVQKRLMDEAFSYALEKNRIDIAQLLIISGADLPSTITEKKKAAIEKQNTQTFYKILKKIALRKPMTLTNNEAVIMERLIKAGLSFKKKYFEYNLSSLTLAYHTLFDYTIDLLKYITNPNQKFLLINAILDRLDNTRPGSLAHLEVLYTCLAPKFFGENDDQEKRAIVNRIKPHVVKRTNLSEITASRFLFRAVTFDDPELIDFALQNEANPNLSINGDTALHKAISHYNFKIAEQLLSSGASLYRLNNNNKTPLALLEQCLKEKPYLKDHIPLNLTKIRSLIGQIKANSNETPQQKTIVSPPISIQPVTNQPKKAYPIVPKNGPNLDSTTQINQQFYPMPTLLNQPPVKVNPPPQREQIYPVTVAPKQQLTTVKIPTPSTPPIIEEPAILSTDELKEKIFEYLKAMQAAILNNMGNWKRINIFGMETNGIPDHIQALHNLLSDINTFTPTVNYYGGDKAKKTFDLVLKILDKVDEKKKRHEDASNFYSNQKRFAQKISEDIKRTAEAEKLKEQNQSHEITVNVVVKEKQKRPQNFVGCKENETVTFWPAVPTFPPVLSPVYIATTKPTAEPEKRQRATPGMQVLG